MTCSGPIRPPGTRSAYLVAGFAQSTAGPAHHPPGRGGWQRPVPALAGQYPPAARHRGARVDPPRPGRHRRPDRRTARPGARLLGWWTRSTNGHGATLLQRAAGTTRRPRLLRAARRPARRAQPGAARRLAGLCQTQRGRRPGSSPSAAAPPNLRTLTAIAAGLGIPQAGSSARPSTPGCVVLGDDGAWFRHPLLADVLAESYLPGEAGPVHAAWAGSPGVALRRRCRRAAPAGRPRAPP